MRSGGAAAEKYCNEAKGQPARYEGYKAQVVKTKRGRVRLG